MYLEGGPCQSPMFHFVANHVCRYFAGPWVRSTGWEWWGGCKVDVGPARVGRGGGGRMAGARWVWVQVTGAGAGRARLLTEIGPGGNPARCK
jgi:hypothetical protein